MSARADMVAAVQAACDAAAVQVRVVASVRQLSLPLSIPAVIVDQTGISRFAPAPMSHVNVLFSLRLVSNHQNVDKAEDQLDDLVDTVTGAMTTARINWDDAVKEAYRNYAVSYTIPTTLIAKKV